MPFQAVSCLQHMRFCDRRGFEVLLRKVLNYKSAPAVVILHWWSPVTQVSQRGAPTLHVTKDIGFAVLFACCAAHIAESIVRQNQCNSTMHTGS